MACKVGKAKENKNCEEISDSNGPYNNVKDCEVGVVELMKSFYKVTNVSTWEITDYSCKKRVRKNSLRNGNR